GGEVEQRSALRDLRGWSARGGCRLRIGRPRRVVGRCYRRSSVVGGAEVEEGPAAEVGVLGGGGRLRCGLGLGFGLGRVVRLEVEQRGPGGWCRGLCRLDRRGGRFGLVVVGGEQRRAAGGRPGRGG